MSDVPPSILPAPPLIIWFAEVFVIWRRRWPLWLGLGALNSVLTGLVYFAIYHAFVENPPAWVGKGEYLFWDLLDVQFTFQVITLPIDAIFSSACILLALRLQCREPAHLYNLAPVPHFFWRALGTEVLTRLLLLAGVLAFCVGVIVVYPITYLAMPAMVAEGAGPEQAIKRSLELTRSQFWRILLFATLFSAIALGISSISIVTGQTHWPGQTIAIIVGAITGPIIVISQAVAYTFSTGPTTGTTPAGHQTYGG